jgi:putative nucleotidyltransferase with HDIG domain
MVKHKKIHVGDLRVGMFVSKLDRDWLDTPFLMQGFLIESADDIDIVSEFCEHVWIDAVGATVHGQHDPKSGGTLARSRPNYIHKVPLREERERVLGIYREARSITKSFLDDVRLGGTIDTAQAKATVHKCVQSILRNPDALLWMAKVRNQHEYTAEHCLNVCILAIAFGRHLGMDETELEKLGLCGLLHDVGKMRVPPEILDKPAALTPKETRMMMAHTVHGRNLLMAAKGVYEGAVDVAYSHHERLDGLGYPRKLSGSSISRFSRIISIVDAYDAMTGDRCYAVAKTSTEAVKIIYHARGTHFDDYLSLQFIKSIGLYPPGSIVELYSGQVGIVVETNQRYRHLPKIVLMRDEKKEILDQQQVLDLSLIEAGELNKRYLIKQVWRDGSFGIFLADCQKNGLQVSPS